MYMDLSLFNYILNFINLSLKTSFPLIDPLLSIHSLTVLRPVEDLRVFQIQ